jgi:hypothetical protein
MTPRKRTPEGTKPLSIQGEQQAQRHTDLWANEGDAREFLESLPLEMIECRARRHRFDPYTVHRDKIITVTEQCACGARRVTQYTQSRYGLERIDRPQVTYPRGYLAKGIGRLTGGPALAMVNMRHVTVAEERINAATATPRRGKRAG